MRSVSSRPGVLAHRVDAVDQLVDAALAGQLVVDRGVERDRDAGVAGDRPALLAGPLDEHLVRAELVAERRGSGRRRAPRTRRPGERPGRRRAPCRASARARAGAASRAARRRRARTRPSFTRSSSAISSACAAASGAPSTTIRRSGCRSLRPDAERAWWPSATTLRSSATSASRRRPAARASGQPARKTELGAPSTTSATSACQRCSARNGITGAITRTPWTSPNQSVRRAVSSPSQKRRRERRMYQFERSSTYASKARVTSTVSQRS